MIYTTGTIAINGYTVTGTGTNFSAPLSLIRVGCTIIAVGNPVQIFTITEIKSGTELSVTPAANPTIAAGTKFSILLSDSISVDGLAQDVAETLRYYQGRETELAAALDWWKEYGDGRLDQIISNIRVETEKSTANAQKTEADKNAVTILKIDAESSASAAETSAGQASASATAAGKSAESAETAAKRAEDAASYVDIEDASTTKKGIVQLSSATNSDSETLAATPKAVKEALDKLNELVAALAGKQPLDNTLTNLSGKDVSGLLEYLGLGEAAKRDIGIGANQIPDMNKWTSLKADFGWRLTPDGFLEQWGRGNYGNGEGDFVIPFPNRCIFILISSDPNDSSYAEISQAFPVSNTKFRTGCATAEGNSVSPANLTCNWYAKGW
ncbi:phage tail protein [Escherichia coli]|uniref:phage tail protein n=1 Tax=Escherichia coli TaxID=562 RepID=UPI0018C66CA9|nr:phage tail protein [Escherichia coli]